MKNGTPQRRRVMQQGRAHLLRTENPENGLLLADGRFVSLEQRLGRDPAMKDDPTGGSWSSICTLVTEEGGRV